MFNIDQWKLSKHEYNAVLHSVVVVIIIIIKVLVVVLDRCIGGSSGGIGPSYWWR